METYSIIKGKTVWTGVYMVVGMILEIVINSAWLGFAIGLGVSLCIGAIMDNGSKKGRKAYEVIRAFLKTEE